MRTIDRVAMGVGRGIAAGAAGTAAMTASSTWEMKLRRRPASNTPAQVVETVLHIEPLDEASEARRSNLVHWFYGTSWGVGRALVAALGLRGPLAGLAHFGLVWGTSLVLLPGLRVAPPVFKWSAGQIAIDVLHHAVYASATDAVYRVLGRV